MIKMFLIIVAATLLLIQINLYPCFGIEVKSLKRISKKGASSAGTFPIFAVTVPNFIALAVNKDDSKIYAIASSPAYSPKPQILVLKNTTSGYKTLKSIKVDKGPVGIAYSAPLTITTGPSSDTGEKVYITNSVSGTISVIDVDTNEVIKTIGGLTVSLPDPMIGFIDTMNGTSSFEAGLFGTPVGVAVNDTTRKVYVADYTFDTLLVINGATDEIEEQIAVGHGPTGVAVNPETNTIYVANSLDGTVSVIDGSTNTVTSSVEIGNFFPSGVVVDPDTGKAFTTKRTSSAVATFDNNQVTSTAEAFLDVSRIAIDPENDLVYLIDPVNDTLLTISISSGKVIGRWRYEEPPLALAFNKEKGSLFIAFPDHINRYLITPDINF